MKIESGKTYINGNKCKVEIIKKINCFEREAWVGIVTSSCEQMGEYPAIYTSDGCRIFRDNPRENLPSDDPIKRTHDLVSEYHPAHEWEIDKPIWVRGRCGDKWMAKHFSHRSRDMVWAWSGGGTSHSTKHKHPFNYATDKDPYKEQDK